MRLNKVRREAGRRDGAMGVLTTNHGTRLTYRESGGDGATTRIRGCVGRLGRRADVP